MSGAPTDTQRPAMEVTDLVVRYGKGRKAAKGPAAVDGVSFTIAPGETLGLVGESGSGKSTIGKALIGLQPASSGTILLHGKDVTTTSLKDRAAVASELRVVFQDPYSSLNPARTVGQTLAEPLSTIGIAGDEARRRSIEALESVGLPRDSIDRFPAQFSGGQRQRVAIARALVCEPNVIVLDEPVSALDLSTQAQVLNLLADLRDERGLSFLFIAHDLGVVRFLSQRVVVLYRGQIMEMGDVETIIHAPRHPYTVALNDAAPVPRPAEQAMRRRERESLGVGSASTAPPDPNGCPFSSRCPLADKRCHAERPALRQVGESLTACHKAEEVGVSWPPRQIAHEESPAP